MLRGLCLKVRWVWVSRGIEVTIAQFKEGFNHLTNNCRDFVRKLSKTLGFKIDEAPFYKLVKPFGTYGLED